ncbi:MAG: GNAT family N-acetyltransferase [Actinomycetota bacterium]
MLPLGYTLARPLREDAAAVAQLVADFDTAIFGSSDTDIEDLKADWNAPGFSLDDDAWIVWAASGEAAGYATADWHDKGKEVWGDAFVHPNHAGRGVGSFLVDVMEERFAVLASEYPGAPIIANNAVAAKDTAAATLLESRGYCVARRDWQMRIDVDDSIKPPQLPDGITISPIVWERDLRALHAVHMSSFASHRNFVEKLFDEWVTSFTSHPHHDATLWRAAWDGETIVGIIVGRERDGRGFVRILGVAPTHRGRGIGEALLRSSFAEFASRGFSQVMLGVDSENATGATRLYERCGMRVDREFAFYRKSL